ncbi:MAG TPA: LLM class F420-dependent oxidoreductase [Dermatophilaceae bacterium]|nr:LLM class F420-dependent oxidoreductase [Dermatophilaceae bacterium]
MRLGLSLSYWGSGLPVQDLQLAQEADRLGYDVVWAAEAFGADAVSMLGWLAGQTEHVGLGSAVLQVPARSAAMTAMTAATLDLLSGGRFRLGLGVSGPQVSEGWHGVRFDAPLQRTREYVDVVRLALSRQTVAYQGRHIRLPLPEGPGKAIHLTVRRVRPRLPIYLAALGPKNLELAGEIADGWLGFMVSPEHAGDFTNRLRAGARRAGRGTDGDPLEGFDVVATVPVSVHADVAGAADRVRSFAALYLGGMGSREQNFYQQLAGRLGFAGPAARVQELFLAGEVTRAAQAVPLEFLDHIALLGPPGRIAERMQRYAAAGVSTLTISPYAETLDGRLDVVRMMAEFTGAAAAASEHPSRA